MGEAKHSSDEKQIQHDGLYGHSVLSEVFDTFKTLRFMTRIDLKSLVA